MPPEFPLPPLARLFVTARSRVPTLSTLTPRDLERVQQPPRDPLTRAIVPVVLGVPARGVTVSETTIPGPGGELPVTVVQPARRGETTPLVVHFHGGGWVTGHHRTGDWICTRVASRIGAVVVSIGYRLAPQHRFPAAVEDAVAGLAWAAGQASRWGTDRLGVLGDSAGANLAAVAALTARDAGGPQIWHQGLLYPVVDARMAQDWVAAGGRTPMLQPPDMLAAFTMYTGGDEQVAGDWRFSPLRAGTLAGLPPTSIAVGGLDPLHDQGVAYARRLEACGVQVRLREYPQMPHGWVSFPYFFRDAAPALDAVIADQAEFLGSV